MVDAWVLIVGRGEPHDGSVPTHYPMRRLESRRPGAAFCRQLAIHHLAAIDMDGLATDIGRVLTGQIDISRTQLGRLSAAAHGHLAAEVFEHLRVVLAERRRL